MQGREDAQRGYLDVEALAGELLVPGSVFAFLAEHRGRLFPDSMMEDLFPSGRGRPSVPAPVIGSVSVLQALQGLGVACQEDGTAVARFLPPLWDHLFSQSWDHSACCAGESFVSMFDHRGGVDV